MRDPPVTVRVITLKGPDAGRYYVEEMGRYYLDGDEPPGRWHGAGAEALGLSGTVDDGDFLALMDGLDPATGEALGTGHTARTVRGFDVTCSAPKSVSLLFAVGDQDLRNEVLAAHDAAVDAVADWFEAHAHTRHRVDGQIWTVDASGVIAAMFRQHTSRANDPQLHTHVVVPNRVLAPDGRWLALDARTLKCDQRTMSALYHAGLRAEVTRRIGARWLTPENGIAEMADADPDVLAAFSERTRQVEERATVKVERFADNLGRPPTSRERWRLEREAVEDSRPTKTSVDAPTLHQRWLTQLHDLGIDRDQLVTQLTGHASPIVLDEELDERIMTAAETALRDSQSVWRPAEVSRALAAAVPTEVALSAEEVGEWVEALRVRMEAERLVDISRPIPDGVPLRRDGRPVTESAVDRLLTTEAILAEEAHVLTLAQRWADQGGTAQPDLTADDEVTAVQREAASAVAGTRRLVLVVGPAGTGKTTALRPAVAHLRADGRPVFGVAPSATAAEVLAVDTGIDADTVDKLLIEHRLERPPHARYDLPRGSTVIVDEAAMLATPRLAELIDLADRRGWRLALVGDPMQFSAVGRSGMFGHLVDTIGATELDRVHRFHATWERDASLGLRRGETDIVATYDAHDRLHGGTAGQMARATVTAWRHATCKGETAAMMAPTREGVATLNTLAQAMRIGGGEIDPNGPSVQVGEHRVYVGDTVATRRNDRRVLTDRGLMVKNRDRWTIETVGPEGGLTVTGASGQVQLPAEYVAHHVELAYAETSHANQGRTVDRSFLYLDGPTDTRGIYVALTRGRSTNEAFVTITGEQIAAEVVADAVARTWIDQPATAQRLDQPIPEPPIAQQAAPAPARPRPAGAPRREPAGQAGAGRRAGGRQPAEIRSTMLSEPGLRSLVDRAVELQQRRWATQYRLEGCQREVVDLVASRSNCQEDLVDHRAQLQQATEILAEHDRPLHRRGRHDTIAAARTNLDRLPVQIAELEAHLPVLEAELRQARADQAAAVAELSDPTTAQRTNEIRVALDQDATTRGRAAATNPSPLLVHHLGSPPSSGPEADAWITAAGRVAQLHTLFPVREGEIIGRRPRALGQDDYAFTHHAAKQAVEQLDQTLGRSPRLVQEPPGLSR